MLGQDSRRDPLDRIEGELGEDALAEILGLKLEACVVLAKLTSRVAGSTASSIFPSLLRILTGIGGAPSCAMQFSESTQAVMVSFPPFPRLSVFIRRPGMIVAAARLLGPVLSRSVLEGAGFASSVALPNFVDIS